MLCTFPRSALGLRLQRSGWISVCISPCQSSFPAGIQHRPCGEPVSRRKEASCTKLGEREANITIINSWHVFLPWSEVCSAREQKTIVWHGACTMYMMCLCNGTTVHFELEGSEPRYSEECEHLIVGLGGERVQVCLFRKCARFWSLEELCSFFAAIVFHGFHRISCVGRHHKDHQIQLFSEWPIRSRNQEQRQAVCPSVAYQRADRAGELSVRIYKLLFGLKILRWLNWVLLLQSTQPLYALLPCQDCITALWETHKTHLMWCSTGSDLVLAQA